VRLEPYAVKVARTVLRERGGGDTALLPGAQIYVHSESKCISIIEINLYYEN